MIPCLLLLAAAASSVSGANAVDDSGATGREADIFGGADTQVLEEPSATNAQATERLADAYDKLDVGGFLYFRAEYQALDEGEPATFRLTTPDLLDVYLDGRPSDRVRGYARARVNHDPTIGEGELDTFGRPRERTRVILDQLWLKFDVLQSVFITAGRQRIKWGAGRFWNPTDFVNQAKLDPLAVIDERTGLSLFKIHFPIESLGWNFYAVANLEDASSPENIGGALRAEFVAGSAEVSVSAGARKDNPLRLGADLSMGLWDFDLRGEIALQHGVKRPFYRGEFDLGSLTLPEEVSRQDDWISQAVVGAEIPIQTSEQESLTLGAEYFFNDAGYDNAELYPYLAYQGVFEPFYVGRHYAAAYAVLVGPGTWDDTTFMLTALGNLSDRSYVSRFDYRVLLLQHLRFDAHAAMHFGELGELRFGFDVPAIPPATEGFSVAPPLLDLGIGLAVDL